MAAGYGEGTEKKGMSPLIVALAVIALVAIAGFIAYRNMPRTEVMTIKDTPDIAWLKQKAKQTQGDFSKLSPAEQQRANGFTGNRGAFTLKTYWETQK